MKKRKITKKKIKGKPKRLSNAKHKKIKKIPTERKEYARFFASYQLAISKLRQFYIKEAGLKEMFQETADLLIKSFGYYMVWYGQLKEDEKIIVPVVWAGKYEKYLDGLRLKLDDSKDAKCAMSIAIVTKEPFGYMDLEGDKDFKKWRPLAIKYGYRSNQAIPLIIDGKSVGAFLIYSTRPFAFPEELTGFLKGIVSELAIIIENITIRKNAAEKLQKAYGELEIRVKERTLELEKINEALQLGITNRKKVEEDLRRAYNNLREARTKLAQSEKLASIGQMATGVAHEVNNPLSVICGEAEMLLRHKGIDEDTKNVLKVIMEHCARIKGITERLLEYTRKRELKTVPLDINNVLEKCIPSLHHRVKMDDIEIVKEFEPNLPQVGGDASQLEEVFFNIILNAVQAMEEKGKLSIRTYADKITKYGRRATDVLKFGQEIVVIEFKDTGKGMDEKTLKMIFTPFFTTKEKNTGLGLFISYGIIQNHNGVIEVQSKLKKGSTVIVKLPVTGGGMNKKENKKILVVDDEPAVCDMLRKFLAGKGYKVSTALSGKEALSKVRRERPYIVLLDIKMPQMGGVEVLERIKEFDKKIGVVMITAVKDDEVGKKCIEMGAYDYITKPIGLDYLESVVSVKLLNFDKK